MWVGKEFTMMEREEEDWKSVVKEIEKSEKEIRRDWEER